MNYFIDTSFWCALYDCRDARHEQARRLWESLSSLPVRLFTSDYIFDETMTLIRRRMDHRAAVELGQRILQSEVVRLLAVTADIRHESWAMFKKYADKTFSFTDCTSFTLMRLLGLDCALAFDQHFSQMGFAVNRPPKQVHK